MRRTRLLAATAAIGLSATALAATAGTSTAAGDRSTGTTATTYVVLADKGATAQDLAAKLTASGATVTSVNKAIGLLTVTSTKAGFASKARGLAHVDGVALNRSIGYTPNAIAPKNSVERESVSTKSRGTAPKLAAKEGAGPTADPLDSQLWGMDMINADEAHKVNRGDHRVTVGVLDTGVQGDHPDLRANFNKKLSRNFVTDMPDIDGECEFDGCVDPAGWDDGGHGTHVAGTIAAALNGMGLSGVAPNVDLVNIRGGQDSGYFFLQPTVDALTYAGNAGIDVVNMSFYVDPWLYNCEGGAPEDSPEQAAQQDLIIEAMERALGYAHDHDVTLVGSLGNSHEDLSNPRHDFTSPDYPGGTEFERTIDNATCFDLPVEGPHVLGISSLGPSGKKSDFSNYATDLTSGEIEFSAPGGWFRDFFGTPFYRTNGNQILSTAPTHVLQEEGLVDANLDVTPAGVGAGVQKACDDLGDCGFYQFLQGTSMASPHASGVAALTVSAHGHKAGNIKLGLTLSPDEVAEIMAAAATDHACPDGGVQSYTQEGRSAEFTAVCTGTPDFNAFYGNGIVNALGVVQ
jgi:lantibiotic leader peptide-processing serine protease